MITKRKLKAENERLKQDNATLKLMTKAYMRKNKELENHIEFLNASLKTVLSETNRWKDIAHKADERRRNYIRANNKCGK